MKPKRHQKKVTKTAQPDAALAALLATTTEITLTKATAQTKKRLRTLLQPIPPKNPPDIVYRARVLCREDLSGGRSRYWTRDVADCTSAEVNNEHVFGSGGACGIGGVVDSCGTV